MLKMIERCWNNPLPCKTPLHPHRITYTDRLKRMLPLNRYTRYLQETHHTSHVHVRLEFAKYQ